MTGIYRIESLCKPERAYIGSSVNIKKRWQEHLRNLRSNHHHSQSLQNHYNKYGEQDLIFIIIELCLPEFLIAREQHYIDSFNPIFNSCKIAGSRLGFKLSDETKLKLSKIQTGRRHSAETLKKMRELAKYRPPMANETKEKLREAGKGRHQSEESKRKLREAAKNRPPISEETRKKLSEAAKNRPAEEKERIAEIMRKHRRPEGYSHSEATRKKISEIQKGRKLTEEHKNNISKGNLGKNLGKKHSDEALAKMRRPRSEEGKQNMRKPHNVKTSWNKGKKLSEEQKKNLMGRIPWNKGMHYSDEAKQKMAEAMAKSKIKEAA